MNGDFGTWFQIVRGSLKDEPTRGYATRNNRSLAYQMEKDHSRDHPLFDGRDGTYYDDGTEIA